MDKHIFQKEILGLYKFFRRKKADLPDDSTIDDWYSFLKIIPNNAFVLSVNGLKNKEKLPFNIPKALKDSWQEYVSQNPRKVLQKNDYIKCNDCNSSGGFLALIYDRRVGLRFPAIKLCSACNNWTKIINAPNCKRISAQQLEKEGVPYKPYNQVLPARWNNDGWIGRYTLSGKAQNIA